MFFYNNKKLIIIISIVLVLAGASVWYIFSKKTPSQANNPSQSSQNTSNLEMLDSSLSPTPSPSSGSPSVQSSPTTEAIKDTEYKSTETFTEPFSGFSIEKPKNWQVKYTTGVITVTKDNNMQEGFLVYPVVPENGLTLVELTEKYLSVLKNSATSEAQIDYSGISENNNKVTTSITGNMNGKDIRGSVETIKSGQDYILKTVWAQAGEFSSKESSLAYLADTYKKTNGKALVTLSGKYFQTKAPADWIIKEETSNGINIASPNDEAGVMSGYFDFGGDPNPMTLDRMFEAFTRPCSAGQDPCYSITRTYNEVASVDAPDFQDNLGRTWKARAEEFDATLVDAASSRVHGVYTGMVMNGQNINGLYGWIIASATRISKPELWDKYSAITAIIQDNLTITQASELITNRILPRNNPYDSSTIMGSWEYKNKVDDELSQKRREAIMGFSTMYGNDGTSYEVPLNNISEGGNPTYINASTGETSSESGQGFQQLSQTKP